MNAPTVLVRTWPMPAAFGVGLPLRAIITGAGGMAGDVPGRSGIAWSSWGVLGIHAARPGTSVHDPVIGVVGHRH